MRRKLSILIVVVSSLGKCFGQIEVSPTVSSSIFLDELKDIFKPALNYSFTFSKGDKYKAKRNSWGITLGYSKFSPRDSVFYYRVNENEIGKAYYGDYVVYQLTSSFRKDYILSDRFELYWGFDIGYYYVVYDYATEDSYVSGQNDVIQSRFPLLLRGGVNFLLSKSVVLFLQTQGGISLANDDDGKDQIINSIFSPGFGVQLRFYGKE